jgi:hypothetical protein
MVHVPTLKANVLQKLIGLATDPHGRQALIINMDATQGSYVGHYIFILATKEDSAGFARKQDYDNLWKAVEEEAHLMKNDGVIESFHMSRHAAGTINDRVILEVVQGT